MDMRAWQIIYLGLVYSSLDGSLLLARSASTGSLGAPARCTAHVKARRLKNLRRNAQSLMSCSTQTAPNENRRLTHLHLATDKAVFAGAS